MDHKLLSEAGWKVNVVKFKLKDTALSKALVSFANLDEEKYDERIKAAANIAKLAGDLKKSKDIVNLKDVVAYLAKMLTAAVQAQNEIKQDKVLAEKAEKAVAAATAKAAAKAKEAEVEEDEDENPNADSFVRLAGVLKSIRTAKVPYTALICPAKPYGLVMSKKDISMSMAHKKELATMAGGSTRPPLVAHARFENNKLVFEAEKPPSGLAGILKKWIKLNLNVDVKVMVGAESDDDEPTPSAAEPEQYAMGENSETETEEAGKKSAGKVKLIDAPEVWLQTRRDIGSSIDKLKAAVRKEFASEGPKIVADIDKNLGKLDGILGNLDDKLSVSISKANGAPTDAARKAALNECRKVLDTYSSFVKSEKLIDHIDSNPFGVDTGLRKALTATLKDLSAALN